MDKRELQQVLDRSGSKLITLCRDLGLAKSTASRWGAVVPAYARLWAASLAVMTPEQVAEVRRLAKARPDPAP